MPILTVGKISEQIQRDGASKTLALIYKTSFPKIRGLIRKMSGSNEDAQDVFQEVVIRFYTKIVKAELDASTDAEGYLYVMARNAWLTKLARKQTQVVPGETLADIHAEPATEGIQQQELKKNITSFFSTLGKRCEELLIYKYYYDYSMQEISEKMEFSNEDSAKTQHYKCKQLLIEKVKKFPQFKQLLRDAIE